MRRGTALMDRALLNAQAGVAAPYVTRHGDPPAVAPIRARVRLCCTTLSEHRHLRHQTAACVPPGRAGGSSGATASGRPDSNGHDGNSSSPKDDWSMACGRGGDGKAPAAIGDSGMDRCRACGDAAETAAHVFLDCKSFTTARETCCTALRAAGVALDMSVVGGVGPATSMERRVAVLRATAGLLLAVRARIRL